MLEPQTATRWNLEKYSRLYPGTQWFHIVNKQISLEIVSSHARPPYLSVAYPRTAPLQIAEAHLNDTVNLLVQG